MLRVCILIFCLAAVAAQENKNSSVCYKKVGCFDLGVPWQSEPGRPVPDPQDPKDLKVNLNFFSRNSREKPTVIDIYPDVRMHGAKFKSSRSTTFFIIGAVGQTGHWPIELKDALLDRRDANVFIVNASTAFSGVDIFRAASNSRVVGAELGLFLKYLKNDYGLDLKSVHMIGYGMGAHVAGYTGGKIKVGRITGLDPTQTLFEGFPPETRLDPSDADYVDILHSDARPYVPDLGFGYISPLGHVDFYLNGGHGQPGCNLPKPSSIKTSGSWPEIATSITKQVVSSIYCAHKRSFKVFIESISDTKCTFWGHPGTRENFLRAISNAGSEGILVSFTALLEKCDLEKCVPLGLDSPKSKRRGIHVITTTSNSPYCIQSEFSVFRSEKEKASSDAEKWFKGLIGSN